MFAASLAAIAAMGAPVAVAVAVAAADAGDPLTVRVEGPPSGPHYVGQAIPIRILVTAGAEEPEVVPPSAPSVEVIAAGREVRPISASSIGAVVHEENEYRFDFLLVPRQAGRVLVPAFRARVGDRAGASGPVRLDPISPPAFGRPPWFLGGVGPLEVEVIPQPGAIRLGESAIVTIRLTGPGSLGSTVRPTLRGPSDAAIPAEVVPLPGASESDPPTRTFPCRVRPYTAGTLALAPVLVAWFDPGTRSYRTVGSRGVSIRVDDPPRFDPRSIEVATIPEGSAGPGRRSGLIAAGIGAAAIVAAGAIVGWRAFRARGRSARRFAAREARRLRSIEGRDRAERAVLALVGYLRRAIGRPEGALTPPEAREAVAIASGDPELADRAARLIAACDAARYSGRAEDGDRAEALADAPELMRGLARVGRGPGWSPAGGREGGRRG